MLVLAKGRDPEELIKEDAYDIEAWYVLIHRLKKDPIDICRPHFEKLVKVFPSCGLYWKVYIEQEIAAGNFAQAESVSIHDADLFDRCLLEVLSIDLWKCYVKYVSNHFSTRNVRKVRDAFEFALDKVGLDHQAYSIYNDYVDFLVAANSAGEIKLDESIAIIRKVYLRAINTPMAKHSLLWKRYCAFEQKVDVRQANGRTAAVGQVYLRIQQLSMQMDAVMCKIDRKRVSVPCTNSAFENEQIIAWREFIAWEQSNPLQAVDYCLYARRGANKIFFAYLFNPKIYCFAVIYAYEQALLCFSFHVEFWCEAVEFLQNAAEKMFELAMEEAGRNAHKDTVALFERAINSSMSKTLLIYCLYAEFEESCNRLANVHAIYRRFISRSDVDPSLAYIHYMKFANRTEGIRSVRTIFKAAREDGRVKSEVYTVAALLEYFGNQDASVAVRIFELGLKKFPSDSDFALSYTNFLLHFNGILLTTAGTNCLVELQRTPAFGCCSNEFCLPAICLWKSRCKLGNFFRALFLFSCRRALWDQYIDFESRIGGLTGIVKVSERRQEALSRQFGEMPTALLVDRYRFMDLMPAPEDDLRMLGYPVYFKPIAFCRFLFNSYLQELIAMSRSYETNGMENDKCGTSSVVQPDLTHLIPFKPRRVCRGFFHPVPGGDFPPPPATTRILSMIPPPRCFDGPFVKVDELLAKLQTFDLSTSTPESEAAEKANKKEKNEIQRQTAYPARASEREVVYGSQPTSLPVSRVVEQDDEKLMVYSPPAHDIYLRRRQKKL
ncbi:protein suppressor of forked [Trichuris trichiura]|uniref:Protein suppressor of forked n=1 Tax=Trichuris trichiura TaxID=36087 RepID=A0A077Z5G0_TRITR|nr:protein suppressor of forked [Trichuris trichiura]